MHFVLEVHDRLVYRGDACQWTLFKTLLNTSDAYIFIDTRAMPVVVECSQQFAESVTTFVVTISVFYVADPLCRLAVVQHCRCQIDAARTTSSEVLAVDNVFRLAVLTDRRRPWQKGVLLVLRILMADISQSRVIR